MGALGEQQGKLGQQQGELGRQQADLAQKATRAMKELLDDAIKRGIAQPEPQEPGSASFQSSVCILSSKSYLRIEALRRLSSASFFRISAAEERCPTQESPIFNHDAGDGRSVGQITSGLPVRSA